MSSSYKYVQSEGTGNEVESKEATVGSNVGADDGSKLQSHSHSVPPGMGPVEGEREGTADGTEVIAVGSTEGDRVTVGRPEVG